MQLFTQAFSILALAAFVAHLTPPAAFAATPNERPEGQSVIDYQFNLFPSEADWNND